MKTLLFALLISTSVFARPQVYTELLDYVIQAPDQGETATCLFVGSTGAMEILANKKHHLKHQRPGDRFDLAEQFLIWQKDWNEPGHRVETPIRKFNYGEAIHASDLPFVAWNPDGSVNNRVWKYPPGFQTLPRIEVPKIKTEQLFVRGGKWDTYVLKKGDIELIKEALWKYKSPILVNYNDEGFWHVITIIGYDDTLQDAACYDTPQEECEQTQDGALYIRDSFGVPTEARDADWFRVKGNAAFVVRLVE
ncbi:MAG: hypothetical protein K2P81_13270 [Bacteriovoracaceae bacterium]|nr:hypothetical protein [Bacteriovoracaceae bacterium]